MTRIESLRECGKAGESILAAQGELDRFISLTPANAHIYLGFCRTIIDGFGSLAWRSWSANKTLEYLNSGIDSLRETHEKTHYFEGVRNSLEWDNLYRDGAKLGVVAAALTGNSGFLDESIRLLNRAAQSPRPLVADVARYELTRTTPSTTPQQQIDIYSAYRQSYEAVEHKPHNDQAATMASWFTVDSLKKRMFRGVFGGMKDWFAEVAHNKRLVTIMPRQLLKEATLPLRKYFWQKESKNMTAETGRLFSNFKQVTSLFVDDEGLVPEKEHHGD